MAGSKLSMVIPTGHLDSGSGGGYTHHGSAVAGPPIPAKIRGAFHLQSYNNARPPAGATAELHPSSRRSGERRGMLYAPAGTPRAFKSRQVMTCPTLGGLVGTQKSQLKGESPNAEGGLGDPGILEAIYSFAR